MLFLETVDFLLDLLYQQFFKTFNKIIPLSIKEVTEGDPSPHVSSSPMR
tara:strand:+ start:315 stop:461 length:147 start_codon:yes stop_codon:yes gene_type:complete